MACALLTTVQDGVAIKVHGNPQHRHTDGVLCTKVSRYTERTYHPSRLLQPLRGVEVNGVAHALSVEPRVTLLDLLREQLHLMGTKKGCDHGQCGACTVHVDGKRINSCLSLAVMNEGKKITTTSAFTRVSTLP